MNIKHLLILFAALAFGVSCTDSNESVDFGSSEDQLQIGAEGGTRQVRISSSDHWIASTSAPWITVSPANGNSTKDCSLIIDSALTNQVRTANVRITNQRTMEERTIQVTQQGFDYAITVEKSEVEIDNYAPYDDRYLDVTVKTNVDFTVDIPESASNWLSCDKYSVKFDRGARPRTVNLRFRWGINSRPEERPAEVVFTPKQAVELVGNHSLRIQQHAAEAIEVGTRAGDSAALLAIARSMNMMYNSWENGEPMNNWSSVRLWEKGMEGYTPDKEGRVQYARFFLVSTKEGLPFEVQYLTAAEELNFYSNVNTFLKSLDCGEYICKLTQLRRLTIAAYGLVSLHEDFVNLRNLEFLDLNCNNFASIPEIINPDNFPKLRVLNIFANQRYLIYDLSNSTRTNIGGLQEETAKQSDGTRKFPSRLFKWSAGKINNRGEEVTGLDTIQLSVNYLEGTIPSFEDDPEIGRYDEADYAAGADSMSHLIVERDIPKVMPQMKYLAINLNRLHGEMPKWILYHPTFDLWAPSIMVFNQEGKDSDGNSAIFTNLPENLIYYYEVYPGKKYAEFTELPY